MALPATDNFNIAGPGLSASWTTQTGLAAPQIEASTVVRTNAVFSDSGAWWNADAFNSDHYSQIKVVAASTDNTRYISAAVRCQSGANSFYAGGVFGPLGAGAAINIRKQNAGASSSLTSGTATVNANDVIRMEASGNNLTMKVNGVTVLTTSDSAFTGGAAGIFVFTDTSPNTSAELDDWEGGNLAVGGDLSVGIGALGEPIVGGSSF